MRHFILLEVEEVATSTEIRRQVEVRDLGPQLGKHTIGNRRAVRFSVRSSGREEIRLATGQVFGNPLWNKGKQLAKGELTIIEGEREAADEWAMSYHGPRKDDEMALPAGISFFAFFNHAEFSELSSNIHNGVYPKHIRIEVGESSSLKFGWEPDGSALEWNNRAEPTALPITSVEFSYEFPDAKLESNPVGKVFKFEPEPEGRREVFRAILVILESIRSEMRGVRVAAWLLAVMVILSVVLARKW